ncbi:metallophosphoesterase [candidate division KSB1 bacterium]|nr:metallophosphoesterase [candidate division KSB1 bacterium]
MKVGILADSHDNLGALGKAVSVFNDAEVSLVCHAGDLISPFVSRQLKNLSMDMIAVFGNNDGERFGLSQAFPNQIHRAPHLFTFNHKKILLMHEPNQLDALNSSGQYDCIIYGHTHEVDIQTGKTLVINSGECGGWLNGRRTVAIWDIESGEVDVIPI